MKRGVSGAVIPRGLPSRSSRTTTRLRPMGFGAAAFTRFASEDHRLACRAVARGRARLRPSGLRRGSLHSLRERRLGGPGRTRTCNQTVMSGRISARFVDFAVFSFAFDCVCCVLARSFLVRNWCGGAPAFGRQPANSQLSKRLGNLAQARGTIRVESAGARRLLDHPIGRNEHGDRVGGGVILGQPGQRAARSAA
jgi:hypothetical protein